MYIHIYSVCTDKHRWAEVILRKCVRMFVAGRLKDRLCIISKGTEGRGTSHDLSWPLPCNVYLSTSTVHLLLIQSFLGFLSHCQRNFKPKFEMNEMWSACFHAFCWSKLTDQDAFYSQSFSLQQTLGQHEPMKCLFLSPSLLFSHFPLLVFPSLSLLPVTCCVQFTHCMSVLAANGAERSVRHKNHSKTWGLTSQSSITAHIYCRNSIFWLHLLFNTGSTGSSWSLG